jgi:hypothetical protein
MKLRVKRIAHSATPADMNRAAIAFPTLLLASLLLAACPTEPVPVGEQVDGGAGGCPASAPAPGRGCSTPGRLCRWTRDCGAPGVATVDVGWCTASGVWRVVPGICQADCPAGRPQPTVSSQFGPPPDDHCKANVVCRYPSTPLDEAVSCRCEATRDGRTVWPLCDAWNDGWKPAPPGPSPTQCRELERCGGQSGCNDACPNPAPKSCACGPDGYLYCEPAPPCDGATTAVKSTATTTTPAPTTTGGRDAAAMDPPCGPAYDVQVRALRSSLQPEYRATLTYPDGSRPATELTLRVSNGDGSPTCRPLFTNGGPAGVEIRLPMRFQLVTRDGAFNEAFAADVASRGFVSFDFVVDSPKGTYDPGTGYTRTLQLHGDFDATGTSGVIWKVPQPGDCGCGGKPGCVCPTSTTALAAARWR